MVSPTNPISSPSDNQALFLEQNQQEFAELLTFIDFAAGLTIGFIEVNDRREQAAVVEALRAQSTKMNTRLEVINFSQEPDLRFLRDALVQRLATIQMSPQSMQKLVLVVQGLEAAIGTDGVGAYPPVLQDLNFVRDSYRQTVPHPLLFILPDYAITRISKYAPDFWAWKSGMFTFKTSAHNLAQLKTAAIDLPLQKIASTENQAQIDQLKQLLMELRPTGKPIAAKDLQLCCEIYYKLGSAYLTQRQADKARNYLLEGLKLLANDPNSELAQSCLRKLGHAYAQLRQFNRAIDVYKTALAMARELQRLWQISALLEDLGDVALTQRQFDRARVFYNESLEVAATDRYAQASTYHNLGSVAQELREWTEARDNYHQALAIKVEFGDRYAQARTYHQLGNLAQETEQYEAATEYYQQALEIWTEYGDRYSQAITYNQLGSLAEKLGNSSEATDYRQQATTIFAKFST